MPAPNRATQHWRLVVVGGGSAAAVQVRQGDVPPQDTLVVSERWGTGMEFLGKCTLQSYVEELQLSNARGELRRMLPAGCLRPDAEQFDAYVRESLLTSGAVLRVARVFEIERRDDAFLLHIRNGDGTISYLYADNVVLATGSEPRCPPKSWSDLNAVTHDVVHREIAQGRTARWAGKSVVVVGGGNSGMQVAGLVAPEAADVTILASRYIGMFPSENPDRFAWRAPSQLTYELVGKGELECGRRTWNTPCVRYLVYEDLEADERTIRWTHRESGNRNALSSRSRIGRCRHAVGTRHSDGVEPIWQESRRSDETAVVWATGSVPVLPAGELIDGLLRDGRAALRCDELGRTSEPGIYALGACAGQSSVNETVPARIRGNGAVALGEVMSTASPAEVLV